MRQIFVLILLNPIPFLYFILLLFFSFVDPGPYGSGRYSEHMLPEIKMEDWRKGSQVFIITFLNGMVYMY